MFDHPLKPDSTESRDADAAGFFPKLLGRWLGPSRIPWIEIPRGLRRRVNTSPNVLLIPLFLLLPNATWSIYGRDFTREEFLSMAAPPIATLIFSTALIAYGIWMRRRWVPALAVLSPVAVTVYVFWWYDFHLPAFGWVAVTALLLSNVWYWYFKKNIVEYFRRLETFA